MTYPTPQARNQLSLLSLLEPPSAPAQPCQPAASVNELYWEAPETWQTPDDWETPDAEAKMLAALCLKSDRLVIDPGAGCGNVTRFLTNHAANGASILAIEPSLARYNAGRARAPSADWRNQDFLGLTRADLPSPGAQHGADLVIGNPPFSLLLEFVNHSFDNLLAPGGRIVFLLPGDTFHKPTIVKGITTPFALGERKILGRVAYLKDGVAETGRQVYDSIFILRASAKTDPRILLRQSSRAG